VCRAFTRATESLDRGNRSLFCVSIPPSHLEEATDITKPKRFRGLPKKQVEVFEQIAVGNDGGHHPATLGALQRKGLISFREKRFFGTVVQAPYVPIPIHVEWCEWCATD